MGADMANNIALAGRMRPGSFMPSWSRPDDDIVTDPVSLLSPLASHRTRRTLPLALGALLRPWFLRLTVMLHRWSNVP